MYSAEGDQMRIDHYDLQGEVQHQYQQLQTRKVRNLGPVAPVVPGNTTAGEATPAAGPAADPVVERVVAELMRSARTISTQVGAGQQGAMGTEGVPSLVKPEAEETNPNDGLDNRLRLIKLMIEAMLGHEIELPKPIKSSEGEIEGVAQGEAAPQAAEPDQAVEVTDTLLEQEQLKVVASASVQTSDGQTLQLDLGFVLDWRQLEVSQRRTTLNALKDPLVLSLDGKIADLTEARVNFDIDQDGKDDSLPGLSEGSGFVALDRNGNGAIDDGGELFGARSGNGFGELAALDEDGNGVLDERDSHFSALQFWHPDHAPIALVELGIGAILLRPLDTPFNHLGESGNQGVLRQSGLYLTEQGKGGWVQQIDLRV
ncbi:hypothetical protein [Aeromonas salmonicida]|uniref:hypothetical protein n=1 Tax=Aeromonas salmonicida TaxID=645 RepID=UPI0038BB2F3D